MIYDLVSYSFWQRVVLLLLGAIGLTALVGVIARVPIFFRRDADDIMKKPPAAEPVGDQATSEIENRILVVGLPGSKRLDANVPPEQFALRSQEPE